MNWDDAERRWPECSPTWDRDVAPEGWMPILHVRDEWGTETLWADDEDCVNRTRKLGKKSCRCVWWDAKNRLWIKRIQPGDMFAMRGYHHSKVWTDSPRGPREWRRPFLGAWAEDE